MRWFVTLVSISLGLFFFPILLRRFSKGSQGISIPNEPYSIRWLGSEIRIVPMAQGKEIW